MRAHRPVRLGHRFALALVVLLAACGSDDSNVDKWEFDDAVDAGAACQTNEECGEGAYCHEPSDCEAPKYCADGPPPYSAAPPYLACSCDGTITSVGAGYPGRHAWKMDGAYGMEDYAAACDADAQFPVTYRVELVLPMEHPESMVAHISTNPAADGVEVPVPPSGIVNAEILGRAALDVYVKFRVDADESGSCSEGDAVYLAQPEERRIDMSSFEYWARLRLQETTEPCDYW